MAAWMPHRPADDQQVAVGGVGRGRAAPGMAGAAALVPRRRPARRRRLRAPVESRGRRGPRRLPVEVVPARAAPDRGWATAVLDGLDRFGALSSSATAWAPTTPPGPRCARWWPRPTGVVPWWSTPTGSRRWPTRPTAVGRRRRWCSRPTTASSPGWPASRPGADRLAAARALAAPPGLRGAAQGRPDRGRRARRRRRWWWPRATPGWPPPAPATCWPGVIGALARPGPRPLSGRPRPERSCTARPPP